VHGVRDGLVRKIIQNTVLRIKKHATLEISEGISFNCALLDATDLHESLLLFHMGQGSVILFMEQNREAPGG
jgi:hypothetical protein